MGKEQVRAMMLPGGASMEFIYCPPSSSLPTRSSFWLGKYPVTCAQWRSVMPEFAPNGFEGANDPVTGISCAAMSRFMRTVNAAWKGTNVGLPNIRMWQYACRAGQPEGERIRPLSERAWFSDNSRGIVHAVGGKAPNNWGFCDMVGNVWEWCTEDGYFEKTFKPSMRWCKCGGSFKDPQEWCGENISIRGEADDKGCNIGFRLCFEDLDETVRQKAEQNDPLAQFEMGYRTERKLRDVMNADISLYIDYETAMQWYRRSVESGYEPARNRMETLDMRWHDRAELMKRAEEGDGRAFYDLGKLVVAELEQLFDNSNKDSARFEDVDSEELYYEAESWFERAAGDGDARARTALQELERDWYIEACQPLLNIKLSGCWS